jgi:hypothetical protein
MYINGSQFIDAASDIIAKSYHIIPLHSINSNGHCTCGNLECNSPGKHPIVYHGVKDASNELSMIKDWNHNWPYANMGIVTGNISGIFVLDVDAKSGGLDSLEKLQKDYGTLPDTITVETGGGGLHYYYRYPEFQVKNRAGLLPGIDIRGYNGYVVAPPSNHKSGKRYRWKDGFSPKDFEVVDAPDWLLDIIVNDTRDTTKLNASKKMDNIIPEGSRDQILFKEAVALRKKGWNVAAKSRCLSKSGWRR